jgi:hypothetical protein
MPGARDAPGARDQQPERNGDGRAERVYWDAPGAQRQQPGGSKTVKDKNAHPARTAKDKTRDKSVARALGPDV